MWQWHCCHLKIQLSTCFTCCVIKEQEKEFESQKVMLEEESKERKSLALQIKNYKSMENDFKVRKNFLFQLKGVQSVMPENCLNAVLLLEVT